MTIFIDIGHPAHVHYFKNLISQLSQGIHQFVVTARNKEIAHYLLNQLEINYFSRGSGSSGTIGKLIYMVKADFQLLKIALKEKPDLFLSFGSPYAAQVSSLLGKDHIALDDTENASLGQLFYKPFSECILSPSCFEKDFGAKHIKFNSYMELSYLHPNVYKADKSALEYLDIQEDQIYTIMRFVGWEAAHDIGHNGLSVKNKIKAVKVFEKFGKVFISSESELPADLRSYKVDLPAEKIHDVLAFASLFYGESATMASESAVLGTPAIYLDNEGRGYTREQQDRYGLVQNFTESEEDQLKSIDKGVDILQDGNKKEWKKKKQKLLSEKIDLTAFLVWFISNYPLSKKKVEQSPSIMEDFV